MFNNYYIRNSQTIKNYIEKHPNSNVANARVELAYYYARIACKKGGVYIARNKIRDTSTHRQGCPAGIFLKLTPCANYLEVMDINENHNHVTSEQLFKTMCNQRLQLPDEIKAEAKELMAVGGNKKMIQHNIVSKTGCLITLKDLSNIAASGKTGSDRGKYQFQDSIALLRNVYNCDVDILYDGDDNLMGIFFQDEIMKNVYSTYPEMIYVDGTYCSLECKGAVYVVLVEDSLGAGAVAAVGILLKEDEGLIDWFVKTFKEKNPKAEDVLVIMSDKDKIERKIIKKHFPNAKLIICLFHALKIFNQEISMKNMGITPAECKLAKECFTKIAYASTEEIYSKEVANMKKVVPKRVIDYFEQNWETVRDEWVVYSTFDCFSLSNRSNNRLECVNQKIKAVVARSSTLDSFVTNFFIVVNSHRLNQNNEAAKELNTVSTRKLDDPVLSNYEKLLTDFAFNKFVEQYKRKECETNRILPIDDNLRLFTTSTQGSLEVTKDSCECMFWETMKIMCRHMLKFRIDSGLPLYDENLCLEKWTKSYYFNNNAFFNQTIHQEENEEIRPENGIILEQNESIQISQAEALTKVNTKALTSHEKFKKMQDLCLAMCQVSAEVSTKVFYHRLNILKKIYQQWNSPDQCTTDKEEVDGQQESSLGANCHLEPSQLNSVVKKTENLSSIPLKHSEVNVNITGNPEIDSLIQRIKLPKVVEARGRPKGLGNTVIRLKRKNKKKICQKNKTNNRKLHEEVNGLFEKKEQEDIDMYQEYEEQVQSVEESCYLQLPVLALTHHNYHMENITEFNIESANSF